MFVYAPDITIKVHPIRFGSGSWTTATGVMTGTFTANATPRRHVYPAHGQAILHHYGHIGHWKGGTMDHEWLFWDSQDFMKQLVWPSSVNAAATSPSHLARTHGAPPLIANVRRRAMHRR
jgi:hypothetical protein